MRSPPVPNGVSKIGPKQVCIKFEWVQPMPTLRRAGNSLAGKPLPRTRPAISQVPTKISSSRSMASSDRQEPPVYVTSGKETLPAAGPNPRRYVRRICSRIGSLAVVMNSAESIRNSCAWASNTPMCSCQ